MAPQATETLTDVCGLRFREERQKCQTYWEGTWDLYKKHDDAFLYLLHMHNAHYLKATNNIST